MTKQEEQFLVEFYINEGEPKWNKLRVLQKKPIFLRLKQEAQEKNLDLRFSVINQYFEKLSTEKYGNDNIRSDWDMIDYSKCPRDYPVYMYYPNDSLYMISNNPIDILYFRLCIRKMKSTGFYMILKDKEETRININHHGQPDKLLPGFNEAYNKLLTQFIKDE